jgi:hypothetical protein
VKNIIVGSIGVLAPVLIGCSTHPLPEDVSRVSTYDIVQQARCEAARAVRDYGQGITIAHIAYEFTLDITETNNAMLSDLTFMKPFLTGGNFTLGITGEADLKRQAVRNFKVVDSFDDLRKMNCSPEVVQKNLVYPMTGDIGLYEVVATFARLQKTEHLKVGEVFSFGDTLMFTTTLSAGVKPSLTLNPVTDKFRLTSATADFEVSRRDFHKVILGLDAMQTSNNRARLARGTILARTGFAVAAPLAASTTLLSTTLLQDASASRDRALLELDRQRILQLQARAQSLLVGP